MKHLLIFVMVFCFGGVALADDAPGVIPLPTGQALKAANGRMEEAYHDDLLLATTPLLREQLAWQLYKAGIDTVNDSAGRYVLLCKSRDEAATAGNVDIAFAAIEELNKNYQVDVLTMRLDTLRTCEKQMDRGADFPEVVEIGNALADAAAYVDQYDLANQAIGVAHAAAERSGYPTLLKYVVHHGNELQTFAEAYKEVIEWKSVLAKRPTDPQANYEVGRFRCFVKGDWAGLLMLSLGSDTTSKELATKDLAGATKVEDQVKLGDGWWDIAEKQTGAVKKNIRMEAGKWYAKAFKQLAGLDQARVLARLNHLDFDEELRVVNLLKNVDPAADTVTGTWKLDDVLTVAPDVSSRIGFDYSPPDEYDYEVTFSRDNGNNDIVLIASAAGHQFIFYVGGYENKIAAIENIDGARGPNNATCVRNAAWLVNGRKYQCLLRVRRDSVAAYLDGQFITQYRGDLSKLSTDWTTHHDGTVGLASQRSATTFYSAKIVELSGRGSEIETAAVADASTPTGLSGGTGIVISDDGLILTNRHVVQGAKTLLVVMGDKRIPAQIVATDDVYDLALVRIKPDHKLPFLKLSTADHPNDGADALVMGYPLLFDIGLDIKVTRGIVSSSNHQAEGGADTMIDAKVNHGNSGGPILDKSGNVMAVVCLKTVNDSDDETYGIGISAGHVREFLTRQKIKLLAGDGNAALSSEEIAARAKPAVVCILGAE